MESNKRGRRAGTPGRVTVRQWKQILLFYGNACGRCRVSGLQELLTLDHFIPTAKGGENTWRNVWPLCWPCNQRKGAMLPAEPRPPHVAILSRTGTDD